MKYKQSGSVLAISLVLLTAITLIALTGMQRTGLQTKIVSNIQHKESLFFINESEIDCNFDHSYRTNDTSEYELAMRSGGNHSRKDSCTNSPSYIKLEQVITHKKSLNSSGFSPTAQLRNKRSRSKMGGRGIENFELKSTATLPNAIASSQVIGVSISAEY